MKSVKKEIPEESSIITTSMASRHSLVLFVVALILIVGMFFLVKTYRELREETIVIEDVGDVEQAKATILNTLDALDEDKTRLEAIISVS